MAASLLCVLDLWIVFGNLCCDFTLLSVACVLQMVGAREVYSQLHPEVEFHYYSTVNVTVILKLMGYFFLFQLY